jgi:hypothetical protein
VFIFYMALWACEKINFNWHCVVWNGHVFEPFALKCFLFPFISVTAHSAVFCDLSVQLALDHRVSVITSSVYGSIKEVHSIGHT